MANLSDTFIHGLVDRLCTLPSKDITNLVECDVIRKELGRALKRYCRTEDHGRRTADLLLIESRWRPTPMEIRDAAENTPVEKPTALQAASPSCKICEGTGWEHVQRGMYSAVEVCECRKPSKRAEGVKTA